MAETLRSLFPTADELLAVSADELAPVLLKVAKDLQHRGGGMFWAEPYTLIGDISLLNDGGG